MCALIPTLTACKHKAFCRIFCSIKDNQTLETLEFYSAMLPKNLILTFCLARFLSFLPRNICTEVSDRQKKKKKKGRSTVTGQIFLWVSSFGMIQIRINGPRSLGSWCIKGTEESTLAKDSSVPLMHHDPSDLGSLILIWIILKKRRQLPTY